MKTKIMKKTLEQQYKEETGLNAYKPNNMRPNIPEDVYVEWLEDKIEQLTLCNVSSSLLEITLKDWEYTCGDGCCYTFGKDIYLNGEKLDEQNAEDSENALTAVLNKLGYNVEINYC